MPTAGYHRSAQKLRAENALSEITSVPVLKAAAIANLGVASGTGGTFTTPTLVTPVVSTGLSATGSATNDFSASTGQFKTSSGLTTISGGLVGSVQALTAAGAVNLTTTTTTVATSGAIAITLAAGTTGQFKYIVMITDGGDATLTPTNFANGTTITFNDVNDAVLLHYVAAKWYVIVNNGATVA